MPAEIIQFDEFELDLGRYELRRGDRVVKLEKSPMELLILLVENHGRLVTREEIIQRLWGDNVFVDTRHGINTAVHKLRSALRDDSEQPRILETVVGKGYRLVALTAVRSPDLLPPSVPLSDPQAVRRADAPESPLETRWTKKRSARLSAAGITLTACVVLTVLLIPSGLRDRIARRKNVDAIRSLAVLPFENLSGDPSKEYFADGFTDELTTDLAEQTRILVVSRTSVMRYKGSKKPLPEIARELKVDAIVEGSVVISDQQVRITAQLIQASTDRHLWAHSYERDREDLLPIQNEVATTIASLIRAQAEKQESSAARILPTRMRFTPETYNLAMECFSLGQALTDDAMNRTIQCYQHVIALDPNSAAAYAYIAFAYLSLGLDNTAKAQAAAIKAIDLDPSLPEGHLALANFKLRYEKDFAGAEREFSQALALNPSSGEAHFGYSQLLLATGRTADAIIEGRRMQELNPFSAEVDLGLTFFMAGQYDRALEEEKAAQGFYPQHDRPAFIMAYAYEQKAMYANAIAECQKWLPHDEHGIFLVALGRSRWLAGDSKGANEVKYKIEHFPATDFVWPYDAALFYAALGDRDRAFQWLEKDQKEHDDWLLFLNVDPRLAPLRTDPRFNNLAKRVGLPVVARH